jgi:hypothetical protein
VTFRFFIAAFAVLIAASPLRAQRIQPELRLDVLGPKPYSVQPGLGAVMSLGYYVRVSADVGYATRANASFMDDRWRGDLLARVTLDPFRQQRWGFSLGGGLTFRRRTYLAALMEMEGPEQAGFLPAFQVGVSGGLRGAVVVRRAIPNHR